MSKETVKLSLIIRQSDKAALQRLASLEGETVSVVLRRILRQELICLGILPQDVSPQHKEVDQENNE